MPTLYQTQGLVTMCMDSRETYSLITNPHVVEMTNLYLKY